jgi:hypothetical protein
MSLIHGGIGRFVKCAQLHFAHVWLENMNNGHSCFDEICFLLAENETTAERINVQRKNEKNESE